MKFLNFTAHGDAPIETPYTPQRFELQSTRWSPPPEGLNVPPRGSRWSPRSDPRSQHQTHPWVSSLRDTKAGININTEEQRKLCHPISQEGGNVVTNNWTGFRWADRVIASSSRCSLGVRSAEGASFHMKSSSLPSSEAQTVVFCHFKGLMEAVVSLLFWKPLFFSALFYTKSQKLLNKLNETCAFTFIPVNPDTLGQLCVLIPSLKCNNYSNMLSREIFT